MQGERVVFLAISCPLCDTKTLPFNVSGSRTTCAYKGPTKLHLYGTYKVCDKLGIEWYLYIYVCNCMDFVSNRIWSILSLWFMRDTSAWAVIILNWQHTQWNIFFFFPSWYVVNPMLFYNHDFCLFLINLNKQYPRPTNAIEAPSDLYAEIQLCISNFDLFVRAS